MVIRKGEAWERPAAGPPEWTLHGTDAELAAAVRGRPGTRVGLDPARGCDLARALGLQPTGGAGPREAPAHDLAVDALRVVVGDDRELFGVNLLALGTAPDRLSWWSRRASVTVSVDGRVVHEGTASSVVVASGQYLRGADVVPRGHPGDGRLEVQVYAPRRGEAHEVRRRLAVGTHLPNPRIHQTSGTTVEVVTARTWPIELDGIPVPGASRIRITVIPAHFVVVV
jgi:hypothetical protein